MQQVLCINWSDTINFCIFNCGFMAMHVAWNCYNLLGFYSHKEGLYYWTLDLLFLSSICCLWWFVYFSCYFTKCYFWCELYGLLKQEGRQVSGISLSSLLNSSNNDVVSCLFFFLSINVLCFYSLLLAESAYMVNLVCLLTSLLRGPSSWEHKKSPPIKFRHDMLVHSYHHG